MQQETQASRSSVKLLKLSPKHREALALVAQGVARSDIALAVGYEPEYISWLVKQDVCQQYLQEMIAVVDFRLQAMTTESVDTIADVMKFGSSDERLKAAKLQLEAVGRVGSGKQNQMATTVAPDHLQQLADRLVGLLKSSRQQGVSENVIQDITPKASQSGSSEELAERDSSTQNFGEAA